jgi:hypothetical protein
MQLITLFVFFVIQMFVTSCENNDLDQREKVLFRDNEVEIWLDKQNYGVGDRGRVYVKLGEPRTVLQELFFLKGNNPRRNNRVAGAWVECFYMSLEKDTIVNYKTNGSGPTRIKNPNTGRKTSFWFDFPNKLISDTLDMNIHLQFGMAFGTEYKRFNNKSFTRDYSAKVILKSVSNSSNVR